MEVSLQEELDKAYETLSRWESWQDGNGPEDENQTIFALRLLGALTAASVLCEHPRPDEYMRDLIAEVYEVINGESDEGDDDD